MHAYLEHKTTTHEFSNAAQCLGDADESAWAASFDGSTSNVTLSSGSGVAAVVPTPLKVTHAANCASVAPTLHLQLDTVAMGRLMVGGFDVAAKLEELSAGS